MRKRRGVKVFANEQKRIITPLLLQFIIKLTFNRPYSELHVTLYFQTGMERVLASLTLP